MYLKNKISLQFIEIYQKMSKNSENTLWQIIQNHKDGEFAFKHSWGISKIPVFEIDLQNTFVFGFCYFGNVLCNPFF